MNVELITKSVDEISSRVADFHGTVSELTERLGKLEAKGNRTVDLSGGGSDRSPGAIFTKSAGFERVTKHGATRSGGMPLGLTLKAIVNYATTQVSGGFQSQPDRIQGVFAAPQRPLRFLQILPVLTVASDIVEYATRNVFTNSAGPQAGASPTVHAENVVKPESDITFSLTRQQVETYAHFIQASRQVLDDAAVLESYINGELLHGLMMAVEEDALTASGTGGTLRGILPLLSVGSYPGASSLADKVAVARAQIDTTGYVASHVVMHPNTWATILTSKDNQGGYLSGNFTNPAAQTLWGVPVVTSAEMNDNILVGDFSSRVIELAERMAPVVELSREDDQNFRKNMVTLLAETRIALLVKDTSGFRLI